MKKIIVTIGPGLDEDKLSQLDQPHYILRINGAHGTKQQIQTQIEKLKKILPECKLLIDLPGNKIRTSSHFKALKLEKEKTFVLKKEDVNFSKFSNYVKPNDHLLASDATLEATVKESINDLITFLSHSDGILNPGKGLHIHGINRQLPFLFERDLQLIELIDAYQLEYVGLSFVRDAEDIRLAKTLLKSSAIIIAKIETRSAVENLNAILTEVDHILIDRGDLSSEIGITKLPLYQKHIIEKALFFNKNVFLATQFLKNMETNPIPTIAEVIDLYNTLKTGITGIQLSEETAIGKYPLQCLSIIESLCDAISLEPHSSLEHFAPSALTGKQLTLNT